MTKRLLGINIQTKIFTFLCVFNPILGIYSSPIPGMDFGTFAVLLFAFIMLFDNRKKHFRLPGTLSAVLIYTVLCTALGLFGVLFSDFWSVLFRLLRYVIVLVIMIGIGFPTYFNKDLFIKYLGSTSILVAGFAILQTIAYYSTGIKISGIFGPTKLTLDSTNAETLVDLMYRPPSLFWEPSHAAYFMTPYLCYLLFSQDALNSRKGKILIAILSLGILVTTSGQGLIILAVCWGLWFLRNLKELKIGMIAFSIIFFIVVLSYFDVFATIERVIDNSGNLNAVDARSGGYDIIKATPKSDLIFGYGFGNYDETIYYSSFAEIIFCTGFVGLFLVLLLYFKAFVKGIRFQKILELGLFPASPS